MERFWKSVLLPLGVLIQNDENFPESYGAGKVLHVMRLLKENRVESEEGL